MTLTNMVGTFQAGERLESAIATPPYAADLNGAPTGSGGSLPNNALASTLVADLEGDYLADRIYVGDLYGNMYRVDDIDKNMTPTVSTLFTYDNVPPNANVNPIRAKADYAYAYTPAISGFTLVLGCTKPRPIKQIITSSISLD